MLLMPQRPIKGIDAGARALERALTLGWQQLAAIQSYAQQFEQDNLGDIQLPEETHDAADQIHLRAAAPMYLAMELENAQVIASVDVLAGLLVSGSYHRDLGNAAESLVHFWRGRNERFSPTERTAFFARLFGGESESVLALHNSVNQEFDLLMIDLAEALYKYTPGVNAAERVQAEFPLRSAANRLLQNLLARSSGLESFAAQNILRVTQEALDILKQPSVQAAAGAQSVWTAVTLIARQYLHKIVDVGSHIQRGHSGMVILAWLAQVMPILNDPNTSIMSSDATVEEAAANWLQASLNIEEQKNPSNTPVNNGGAR